MSSDLIPVVVFAAIIALFIGIYILGKWLDRRRRDQIRSAVEMLGLTFQPDAPELLDGRFALLPLFNKGRDFKCTNAATGTLDRCPILAFDYHYTTGHGKHQQILKQTVAAFHVAAIGVPVFQLAPKRWYHAVAGWFGFRFVRFESHPKFNGTHLLRGPDHAAITEWFGPSLLEFLQLKPKWCIESGGATGVPGWLVIYKPNHRPKPEKLAEFLRETAEIAQFIAPS